ncbi:MAG: hypothetical protein ACREOL_03735 [Candidatus Dormibacteria bacterium]
MTQDQDQKVNVLLRGHGTTYAEEAGIDFGRDTPSILFRLL